MFDESIVQYGYEDLLFSKKSITFKFPILHINNFAYHLKLDKSEQYLKKTETALRVLNSLIRENKLHYNDTGISRLYKTLKKLKTIPFLIFIFQKLKIQNFLKNHILTEKPSIIAFDLYRLSYFIELNKVVVYNQITLQKEEK